MMLQMFMPRTLAITVKMCRYTMRSPQACLQADKPILQVLARVQGNTYSS